MPSILCSNARAPVAQLVKASDHSLEDPGSNPGWISMPTLSAQLHRLYICSIDNLVASLIVCMQYPQKMAM